MISDAPKDPIISEAAEIKRRLEDEAIMHREATARTPKEPSRPRTLEHRDRFMTWWRVQVPLANISRLYAWGFVVFVLAATFLGFLVPPIERAIEHVFDAPLGIPLLVGSGCAALLAAARSLLRFTSWRSRLPFKLVGWPELVDYPGFGDEQLWRHCTLEILLSPPPRDVVDAYESALVIFADKARACYFAAEGDQRRGWTASGLTAGGSANRHVARKIKQLCEGNLARLQRKYGCVKQVLISTEQQHFWATRPSNND